MSANGNRDWSSDDDAAIMQAHGRMRGATCFSGIGAPEIAMPHVDWIWHSEIEPFPCAVMAHRHPNNQNLGDILALDFIERAKALGPLDIMVGGPPCQAFSIAGLRGSLSDPRGNLSLRWVQVLHAIRPSIAITENVPGWLSTADNAFGCFLAGIVGADAPSIRHSNEDGGLIMVWLAAPSRARPGVSSMHNMSEHAHSLGPSPNDDAVCSLSSVLEPPGSIPQRFYLTARACAGILRRAENRGKDLPQLLQRALAAVAGSAPTSTATEGS